MKSTTKALGIGGVIFQVEEAADQLWQVYRSEITAGADPAQVAAWQEQIAEVLLQNLNESYPVVTVFDIEIAIHEVDFLQVSARTGYPSFKATPPPAMPTQTAPAATPRLVRNKSRQMIGGVAAGIAHTLGVDELWVRLLWVAALTGFSVFSYMSTSWVLLAYGILWTVLPAKEELQDALDTRRALRHPEDKQLGGVASGLAAYFNVDTSLVRLGLVASLLLNGGFSVLLYLLLWVLMPEALSEEELHRPSSPRLSFADLEERVKQTFDISPDRDQEPGWFRALWGIPRWGIRLLDKNKSTHHLD
ncbi:MAG: PspC domain-containing protein [Bernardetiaceae bacterium]